MRRVMASALLCSIAACAYDWNEFVQDDAGGVDAAAPQVDGAVRPPGDDAALDDGSITPTDAATDDANVTPQDAGVDSPCSASTACIDVVTACGTACGTTSDQCIQACANNGCRNQCRNAETSCRSNCAGQCAACTQAAGCAAPAPCDAGAQTG